MSAYRDRILGLSTSPAFSGSCPVREKDGGSIKYYVTFYSRHPAAMLLMNDAMCRAYYRRMHEAALDDTMFARTDWRETHEALGLETAILAAVRAAPKTRRKDLWLTIVQQQFMRFLETKFNSAVRKLVAARRLDFVDVRGTGKLSDDSRLFVVEDQNR